MQRKGHSEDLLCIKLWTAINSGFVKSEGVLLGALQQMFCPQPLHYMRGIAVISDLQLLVEDVI